jgi:peptide/nickel transport system permease protein
MLRYVAGRIFQMLLVLALVSVAVFSLVFLLPGDVTTAMLGEDASEQDVRLLREKLGLDKPFHIQYLRWAGHALKGDLGRSITNRCEVSRLFAQRLPFTIQLAVGGMLFAVIMGVPLGILSAVRSDSRVDAALRGGSTLGMAMPNFWLGIILIYVFSLWLGWLPSSGMERATVGSLGWLGGMVLPSVTIGARFAAVVLRQTRASFLDVMGTDYVRTARAKGVSEFWITNKHVLRNAVIPVITVVGLQLGRLFGGAVVTEIVFQIPGMGSLVADAVMSRDFPVVQGGVLCAAVGVLGINLVVDIIYGFIDPRIRHGTE